LGFIDLYAYVESANYPTIQNKLQSSSSSELSTFLALQPNTLLATFL
jgi:hypothetical protein